MTAPERRADVRWGLGDAALGWVLAQIGGAIAAAIVLAINDDTTDVEDLSLAWVAVAQLGPQALSVLQTVLDRAGVPMANPATLVRPGLPPLVRTFGELPPIATLRARGPAPEPETDHR